MQKRPAASAARYCFVQAQAEKWRLLLPGASEPRLTRLNARALVWEPAPLTRRQQPEHCCRWQLCFWPDNGGTMPSKRTTFTPSSILFRPRRSPAAWWLQVPAARAAGLWWRRRVPPPGPKGLFRRPFIAIADLADGKRNIGTECARGKRAERRPG